MAQEVQLSVEGMTCGHCQAAVQRSLSEIDGVESVEVSLTDGTALISMSQDVASESLAAAVQSAGYAVTEAPSV